MSLLAAAMICGCSQTTWQTEKYKSQENIGDIKNILIVYQVSKERIAPDLPSLKQSLEANFKRCGILAAGKDSFLTYTDANTVPDTASPQLGEYSQDGLLLLTETRKATWVRDGAQLGDIGRYYTASLLDGKSQKVIWKSDLYLTGNNGVRTLSPTERGAALGKDIVDFLQKDGLVHGC
ncbi:MAG TPA: hypothetical protein VM661_00665 [Candidatus Sulfotelmatobacter sp.]|nr:hypothetical protein [Candidatus Sulfotelmatobacter sp.]